MDKKHLSPTYSKGKNDHDRAMIIFYAPNVFTCFHTVSAALQDGVKTCDEWSGEIFMHQMFSHCICSIAGQYIHNLISDQYKLNKSKIGLMMKI